MAGSIFNVKTFTAAVCLPLSAAIIGTSFSRAAFTSLERYYGISTGELSRFLTVSQLMSILSPIAVNIMSSWHIPRIIHVSFWIKLVGFSVLIAPFFIGPKYSPDIDLSNGSNITDETINGFCYVSRTLQSLEKGVDDNVVSELSSYKYFIPLAYLIIGIGGMVLWPLSLAFIDTNAKPGESGILIAVNFTIIMIGPLIGYGMGGFFLKIWVNIFWGECAPDIIDPRSSQWVGAWWMGYLIPMVAVFFLNIPMAFFPRDLPKDDHDDITEKVALNLVNKEVFDSIEELKPSQGMLSKMGSDTKQLLKNPLYLAMIVTSITNAWAIAAKATFGQKYVEMQFGLTPADASRLKQATVLAFAMGFLIGGVVMKIFKFKAHGLVKYNLVGHLAYMILFLLLAFLPGCTPQTDEEIFGLPGTNQTLAEFDCECDYANFNPICIYNFTHSGKFYEQATVVNPCLAGCSSLETDSEIIKKEFYGCEIEETTGHSREYLGCGGTSTSLGVCNQADCQMKIKIYLGLLCLATFIGGLTGSSGTIFSMRCVEPELKAYSMSLLHVIMKVLGWIPAPILYGIIFDRLCILRGEGNTCVFYHNHDVRIFYFGILTAATFVNACTSFAAYFVFWKRLNSGKKMYGGMKTDEILG